MCFESLAMENEVHEVQKGSKRPHRGVIKTSSPLQRNGGLNWLDGFSRLFRSASVSEVADEE